MTVQQQAIPTAYKGVRFRSKSEARFAYWLDTFENCNDVTWEYEPHWMAVSGYIPDFFTHELKRSFYRFGGVKTTWLPAIEFQVIEYKPAMPTAEYLDYCASRFSTIYDLASDELKPRLDLVLFYGNANSVVEKGQRSSGCFLWSPITRELEDYDYQWLSHAMAEKMLAFRFDLES